MQNNVFKIEIIYEKIILQNVKHPGKFYSAPIPPRLKAGLSQCIPLTFKYPINNPALFFLLDAQLSLQYITKLKVNVVQEILP
jgi:hypothetical protein